MLFRSPWCFATLHCVIVVICNKQLLQKLPQSAFHHETARGCLPFFLCRGQAFHKIPLTNHKDHEDRNDVCGNLHEDHRLVASLNHVPFFTFHLLCCMVHLQLIDFILAHICTYVKRCFVIFTAFVRSFSIVSLASLIIA